VKAETSARGILLLDAAQVVSLVGLEEAIAAVEEVFRDHATGGVPQPAILGFRVAGGGFHVKAALSPPRARFAVKINANFPENRRRFGLPTIQGTITLFDSESGLPLAVMDSIEITILRTAASTAVAAKHLAREDAATVTLCGCGAQARAQLAGIAAVRPIRRAFLYDIDPEQARRFAEVVRSSALEARATDDLSAALRESDVCVTCTPAREPIIRVGDLARGSFVAAVGADSEEKQELEARVLASATVVVDLLDQCAEIGELHHALAAGVMRREDVHAELGEVVSGRKPGRRRGDEIIVFDSTGTALQDVAVATIAFERALAAGVGTRFEFSPRPYEARMSGSPLPGVLPDTR
jgi:alanine dehydrogenase